MTEAALIRDRLESGVPQPSAKEDAHGNTARIDAAQKWRNSAEYKNREIGDKYAKFRAYAVEGLPQ